MSGAADRSWILRLDDCPEGITHLDFEAGAEDLELSAEAFSFSRPLRVDLSVTRTFETFNVQGDIECLVEGECCRCLEPTAMKVEVRMRLLVQRREATPEELEAVEHEEMEILRPGTDTFDLHHALREDVLLEMPLRIYCREDCKGLCGQCGQNFNAGTCTCEHEEVDPRWAALSEVEFS